MTTSLDTPAPRRRRGLLADRSGATALEFALLLPIFLMLVFGVVQIALLLLTQSTLDATTAGAARLIRTGQIRSGGEAAFRQVMCRTFSSGLMDCAKLRWNVQAGASFAALRGSLLTAAPGASTFAPGAAGQPVLVQVFYRQHLVIPFMAGAVAGDGNVDLVAVSVIRNEDYE